MQLVAAIETPPVKENVYILCGNRKNTPRISIEVCERSCRLKEKCKQYRTFFLGRTPVSEHCAPLSA